MPALDARAPSGGFGDSAEYRFEVNRRRLPTRPWINVLANPQFGTQVSEVGAGFTWLGNSRLQQITAWSNDALCDPPSELLLLQDVVSGEVWPLGRGLGSELRSREVAHGIGSTRMREHIDGLDIELCWCVDADRALKQLQVRVTSDAATARQLRLVAFAEWTLGSKRFDRGSLVTRMHRWLGDDAAVAAPDQSAIGVLALLATQTDAGVMPSGASAFMGWCTAPGSRSAQVDIDDWTCDRREFFDALGRWILPRRLQKRAGAGLDACAATSCLLRVSEHQAADATLLLGHGDSFDAALGLARQAWAVKPAQRLQQQRAVWPGLLGAIEVHTPDADFNALVNHWLPYQSIVCRLWARAGFYQAGGAFGFRDQLQDAMGVSRRARRCCCASRSCCNAARQFLKPATCSTGGIRPRGGRAHPYQRRPAVAAAGAGASPGTSVATPRCWTRVRRSLQGPGVSRAGEDLYNVPEPTVLQASIYEHAARAIDCSLATGAHGLPLMGWGTRTTA